MCLAGVSMSLGKVVRSSLWLYVGGVASNLLYFIYWLIASRMVSPSTVGTAAAVIGVASILAGVFSFGISQGTTRLLGQTHGRGDSRAFNLYFTSSFIMNICVYSILAITILIPGGLFGLSRYQLFFVAALVLSGAGLMNSLGPLFNSTLRTEVVAFSSVLSATFRLIFLVALLSPGLDFFGVIVTYIIGNISADAIYLYKCRELIRFEKPSLKSAKEILAASIPSWIPSLFATAGTWLGIIGVYGIAGSTQTGTYYMAFAMASLVYAIPTSLLSLMFPVLSGMDDGRKRATNRSVRLTFVILAPLAAAVIAYPTVPLGFLGTSYVSSSLTLQILLLGTIISPISLGFNSLIYAYGKYRYVTLLGLASNVPRVALYLLLVSMWGANGAAIAYVSGYLFEFAATAFLSKRVKYSIDLLPLLAMSSIPFALAILFYSINVFWVAGVVVILAVSFLSYARLGLVKRSDLAETASAFFSEKRLDELRPYADYIMRLLYGA